MHSIKEVTVAIHNKNGKGLLRSFSATIDLSAAVVAIHNKNGKGLLLEFHNNLNLLIEVAIHNKNGKGLLQRRKRDRRKKTK